MIPIYFEVIGDCYEAFCISAFFSLMCHDIAPDLHSQKDYFRGIQPKAWLWPLTWFARCCGGDRGIWRNPRSGLTWFNVRGRTLRFGERLGADCYADRLGWRLPILCYPRCHDYCRGCYAGFGLVLRGIPQSCLFAYLGMF